MVMTQGAAIADHRIGGIDLGVLGPLEMTVNGTGARLGTPKQRAVLAMLAINRNCAVAMDSLIDVVWEEAPPPAARSTVHCYVSNLRGLISGGGVDPRSVLAKIPPGYRLVVADNQCDLGRFNAAKASGIHAAASGRFEQASRHLADALSQWRGPALSDLSGKFSFAEAFARGLQEDRLIVHTCYVEAEIACGRAHSVIAELEALTAENPYYEPVWAQLMSAYYLCERQSDALETYQRLKKVLADDLGIDPNLAIKELQRRILCQEPLDVQRSASASAEDTVLTLGYNTIRADGPAAATLVTTTGNRYRLAGAVTRIGRSADNDVVLDDPKVSRHHAVIVDTGGAFVITDLNSANGVYVLGERIHPSAALGEGHRVRIGGSEFSLAP